MARLRGNPTLRALDRYGGIPLVALLGLGRRRPRPAADSIRRIGLMKSVAIGDMVLLAGVVADTRAAFPSATLVIISGEDNTAIADMIAGPRDERVTVSPRDVRGSITRLRAARLDALVDFGAWPRFDAVISRLSGARFTVGFETPGQFRHFAYDATVPYSGAAHEVENNRRLAAAIGVQSKSEPCIEPAPGRRAGASPYMVLQPWAGGFRHHLREWPAARWIEVARYARGRGWDVMVTGAPADADNSRALCREITGAGVPVSDAAGKHSLRELTRLLADAEVVVSVNTGVMHLAAAVGARIVGLQGPTSSRRWGPLGDRARAVDSRLPGCGYLNLGSEYAGQRTDCMEGVAVSDVLDAISSLRP